MDHERELAIAAGVAHDVGLAGMLGGNLFGRFAVHPAVREIRDPAERGKVVNASWRRYGVVNGLSLLAAAAGWLAERRRLDADPRLVIAKDVMLAATAATGLAVATEGVRFAQMEPQGAVPLSSGSEPAPAATIAEAQRKRRLDALGAANLACELGLVVTDGALRRARRSTGIRALLRR